LDFVLGKEISERDHRNDDGSRVIGVLQEGTSFGRGPDKERSRSRFGADGMGEDAGRSDFGG
jgi:hypothetical protein